MTVNPISKCLGCPKDPRKCKFSGKKLNVWLDGDKFQHICEDLLILITRATNKNGLFVGMPFVCPENAMQELKELAQRLTGDIAEISLRYKEDNKEMEDADWVQGPVFQYFRQHEGEIIPEEAKQLLQKFIDCGKPPYNPVEAYNITKRLNELGYIILLGTDRYSIVPKKLGLAMLTDSTVNRQLRQLIAEGAGLANDMYKKEEGEKE